MGVFHFWRKSSSPLFSASKKRNQDAAVRVVGVPGKPGWWLCKYRFPGLFTKKTHCSSLANDFFNRWKMGFVFRELRAARWSSKGRLEISSSISIASPSEGGIVWFHIPSEAFDRQNDFLFQAETHAETKSLCSQLKHVCRFNLALQTTLVRILNSETWMARQSPTV